MYKHLLVCNIFFIFLIQGEIIPSINTATKTTSPVISPQIEKKPNGTKTELSEGGTLVSNPVTLPNSNYKTLLSLEKEISGNKEKSVVARKGVDDPPDNIKSHDLSPTINNSSDIKNYKKNSNVTLKQSTILNGTNLPYKVQKVNTTKIHKPLIVSSEALAKMDKINNVEIDDTRSTIKVHAIKVGSHPGMIMPIVITILVVPMFAVVAYMALKRGQEAWKNRHYKRMDFLLDGMYNE